MGGFDEVRYVWEKQPKCAELLGAWVHERKMTQRVEDLTPGEWFKELWSKWIKTLQDWKKTHIAWKDPSKKKALLAKKKEEAKKAKAEAKAAAGEEAKEGEEAAAEEEEAEPMEIDADDIDVFAVEDITDIGNGEPLFANFAYEDWTLLSYRLELHLMLHAWKKDVNDPDRPSFKENHMPFYYSKYFKKQFVLANLNVEKLEDFIDYIKDSVSVNDSTKYFETQLDEDLPFDNFVKMAEEHRRDRQRRVDAGDETATLKFTRSACVSAKPADQAFRPAAQQQGRAVPVASGAMKRPVANPVPGLYGAAKQPRVGGAYGGAPGMPVQRSYISSPSRPMGVAYGGAYGAARAPAAYGVGLSRPGYGMAPAYGAPQGGVYGGGYYRQ